MDKHRLRGLASLWISTLACVSCGSGNFSSDFETEIQQDCYQTLACATNGFGSTDEMQKCVKKNSDALDKGTANQQQVFVDTVSRCGETTLCAYVTCTQSDTVSGYASMHQAQITYDCQQRAACRVQNAQVVATTAVDDCVQEQSSILNAADPTTQAAFEQHYTRCSSFAACSWNNCQ